MPFFLMANGSTFCGNTPGHPNTRHDIKIVAATIEDVILHAPQKNAFFLSNFADARHDFTLHQREYFICTNGVLRDNGRGRTITFEIIPAEQYPLVIPVLWEEAEKWFTEAKAHIFPLVVERGDHLPNMDKVFIRSDEVYPVKATAEELKGRPLYLVNAFTGNPVTTYITHIFLTSDGHHLRAVSNMHYRWYAESLVPDYSTVIARIFFTTTFKLAQEIAAA